MCKQLEISRAAYYKWLHRDTPEQEAENKLKRDFNATAPNEKWSTDVTEFKVPGEKKKLYLSAILDLYDKYPVSYVISCRNDNRLVFRTYDKAIDKHEKIAEGVYKTTFEGGKAVVVNYNYSNYQYNGQEIAARDFAAVKGGEE